MAKNLRGGKRKLSNKLTANQEKILKDYADGNYNSIAKASEYALFGTILGGKKADQFSKPSDDELSNAKDLLKVINSQKPTNEFMTRFDRYDADLKIGDELNWGIHSMSADKNFFDKVISGNDEGYGKVSTKPYLNMSTRQMQKQTFVEYRLEGSKKALNIEKYSHYDQKERLVSGKFIVTDVKVNDGEYIKKTYTIRQK